MIKSIKVPKNDDDDMSPSYYIQNNVELSTENSSIVEGLGMGDEIDVSMKVTKVEEIDRDGKTVKSVRLSIPEDGDKSEEDVEPTGDKRRELMP